MASSARFYFSFFFVQFDVFQRKDVKGVKKNNAFILLLLYGCVHSIMVGLLSDDETHPLLFTWKKGWAKYLLKKKPSCPG